MALNTNESKHELNVIGLLASGGLDSSILLSHLLDLGWRVKPFYIRSGLFWQAAEKTALERYLVAMADPQLLPLTVLDLPLADVYGNHWSITGHNAPEAGTTDEAVFLPGRNALLTIKAALWCQMHGIDELAVATLRSNPFEDASASYFAKWGDVLSGSRSRSFHLVRPFGDLDKQQVMELGRPYPLDLTFSCIAPRDGAHCGQCNKCAERQAAFDLIGSNDPTNYARAALGVL
jgi:7-cyano-7-deazaguanine synthase